MGSTPKNDDRVLTMRLDRILSLLVVALGIAQSLATPLLFREIQESAAWFFAGGLALALVGAVSLVRISHGRVAMDLWRLSLIASSIAALFWLLLACLLFYKFVRYPAAFGALAIICTHAGVAICRSALPFFERR